MSAWFYRGHHPPDKFGVGWPPTGGFVDDGRGHRGGPRGKKRKPPGGKIRDARVDKAATTWSWREGGTKKRAYFGDYARAAVYANTFTAMLGDDGSAYSRPPPGLGGLPDDASLRRAVDVLRRVPFGILEAAGPSYLLLAHAFSHDAASCAALVGRFEPFSAVGLNAHANNAGKGGRASVTSDAVRGRVAGNATLRAGFEAHNGLDRRLYRAGVVLFCAEWRRARASPPGRSCLPALAAGEDPPLCGGAGGAALRDLDAEYPPL